MNPPAGADTKVSGNEQRWRTYLEGIREGQTEPLARLYDETSFILFGLALRVLTDQADAEEVVLDVYQQVWRAHHTYDAARGGILSWLTVMTRSRAIDRLRSAGTRRARELPIEEGRDEPSHQPAPETQSIFAQQRRIIRRALAALAPEQRQAIELAFFRGLTHSEVAERLGAPLGTIKTRIRIGMHRLRDQLASGM
jgi:RNA polymerase sigma-70 factor (ECF subfamily)